MSIVKKNRILVLLFEVFYGFTFNIVGTISISEIFVVIYTSVHLMTDKILRNSDFKKVGYLYLCLLFSQVISEIIVGNTLENSLKGIAVTIVSFCHFYFLLRLFFQDKKIILWVIAGLVLKSIFFGREGDFVDSMEGEDAIYLKFYVAPLISNVLLFLSFWIRKKYISEVLFVLFGIFFIVAGARSMGLILFLSGIASILLVKKIAIKNIWSSVCLFFAIGYFSYVVYVDGVLSGSISSGNNVQLLNVSDNKYNPVNLLLAGRSEVYVGLMAFLDEPLYGHGAWAKDSDKNHKYSIMMAKMHGDKYTTYSPNAIIPSHSIIIGYAMYNGVFALLFFLFIISIFLKYGYICIQSNIHGPLIIVFFMISMIWVSFCSPIAHFRFDIPLYMSFIFYLYGQTKKKGGICYHR